MQTRSACEKQNQRVDQLLTLYKNPLKILCSLTPCNNYKNIFHHKIG